MPTLIRSLLIMLGAALPVLGDEGDGKDRKDGLVAAMKFVKVPKGTFWMGWDSDNKQSKQVEIKQDFELAAFTVTQATWALVMLDDPTSFSRQGKSKHKVRDVSDEDLRHFPVEGVSWDDAQEFVKKINEREKGRGWKYRLPTEAEWEYACRGAATTKEDCSFDYYLAKPTNDLSSMQANFFGDYPGGAAAKGPTLGRPAKVGSFTPNKLGLYDMHGNMFQWCADLDESQRNGALRGGSWGDNSRNCRAAHRGSLLRSIRSNTLGVRLARVPSESK